MDIYVFWSQKKSTLDNAYLERECEKLGISEFRSTAERLAECWFGNGRADEKTEEMAGYVLESGTYGTHEKLIENRLNNYRKNSRLGGIRFFFSRVFLPYRYMSVNYPILKKCPVLLSFCYIHRIIDTIINKRDLFKKYFDVLFRKK